MFFCLTMDSGAVLGENMKILQALKPSSQAFQRVKHCSLSGLRVGSPCKWGAVGHPGQDQVCLY